MRSNLKLVKKHSRARAGEAARRAEAVVPARRDRAEARDLDGVALQRVLAERLQPRVRAGQGREAPGLDLR